MNKSTEKMPPLTISLLMTPFGVMLLVYGYWVGTTGVLYSRTGDKMKLDPPWDWIVGGFFLVMGVLILLTPVYYLIRSRGQGMNP
jgi:hypothetical protein